MTVRRRRIGAWLAGGLIALGALAWPSPAAGQAADELPSEGSCATATVSTGGSGTWTTYAAPAFAAGDPVVTAHAVDPIDPSRWYATNGTSLARSADGGCTWQDSYTLPDGPEPGMPLAGPVGRITALAVTPHPAAHTRLFATVAMDDPASASTVVLRSTDAGATWETGPTLPGAAATVGATTVGGTTAAVPAASDPEVVYVVAGGLLYASADGGSTWEPRTPPSAPPSQTGDLSNVALLTDLVVDPLDAATVWGRDTSASTAPPTVAGPGRAPKASPPRAPTRASACSTCPAPTRPSCW